MDEYTVKRLALVLAAQAEVEGMKAENRRRRLRGEADAYGDEAFCKKARDLEHLAYAHNEQLF